jgi:excisionase family DNA binding protein
VIVTGVLVEPEQAGDVAAALAHWMRFRGLYRPDLARLVTELTAADSGRLLDLAAPTWMTTQEAARALNVSARTVRERCQTGRLTAQRKGARWLVSLEA